MLFRKLKRGFCKESRVLNRQFQEDPGRVYDVFNGMSKDIGDQASERPKYKTRTDISGENKQMFENIDMTNQRHGCRKSREQYMGVSLPQIRGGMGPNGG